jgi:hypothetical protein
MDTNYFVMAVVQTISSIGVLIIAVIAAKIALNQLGTINNQMRIKGTTDLFDRFNDPKARSDRRWIYHHCLRLMDNEQVSTLGNNIEDLEILENVCNLLDKTALFVRHGLIYQNDAIEIYGDSIIRCWIILCPWVRHMRLERRQESWLWENIEWLANQVIEHEKFDDWKKNGATIYTQDMEFVINYYTGEYISKKKIRN